MGDAVRGVMEVEERGVVGGGRCAAYTDTDGAQRGNREWRGSCDPLYHFETSRWFSLSAAQTLRRMNRAGATLCYKKLNKLSLFLCGLSDS